MDKTSVADLDNLPDLDELAEDIVENLESALDSFRNIILQLKQPDEAKEWLLNEVKSIRLLPQPHYSALMV